MRFIPPFIAFAAALVLAQPLFADAMNPNHVHVEVGDLKIHHVWARATAPGAKAGAAYLVVDNNGKTSDTLKSASAPIAPNTMIHESKMTGGVMTMSHVMALSIPAGASVEMKPGGLHVMLMGLESPLKAGTSFRLTLSFEHAGDVTVDVPVLAPGKSLKHTH